MQHPLAGGYVTVTGPTKTVPNNSTGSLFFRVKRAETGEKGMSFVGLGKKTLPSQQEDKPMPQQHSTGEEANQEQGIVVPLELAGLGLLKQEVQPDGTLRIEVIGTMSERVARTARTYASNDTTCVHAANGM